MSRALAIETSGRIGSVALVEEGVVRVEDEFAHGLKHAAEMVPRIDSLCRRLEWKPNDIDEIYVSAGPGSFTGLRIGITFAKTLAFTTGARLVAVPSVQVLAENAPPEVQNLIIVLDAKRGQIFTARFARENENWVEKEPAHLDDLASMLRRSLRPVYLLGDGIPFHRDAIPVSEAGVTIAPESSWRAQAAAVATAGAALARGPVYGCRSIGSTLYSIAGSRGEVFGAGWKINGKRYSRKERPQASRLI